MKLEENMKQFEEERKYKKKLPKEVINHIHQKMFKNIMIANGIMVFLYFISLGSLNIETTVFLKDLKVFSISLLIGAILLFEWSYRKEKGDLAIHGIECLMLAIIMLFSTYWYITYLKDFYMYASIAAYVFGVYYLMKCIVLQQKAKKSYYASLSDIEEIIKNK